MADSTFFRGLTLWLTAFAVVGAVAGGVVAFGFLGIGHAPPAMDDLHLTNGDDANHTVRIEVSPANETGRTVFSKTVRLDAGARVSFENATAVGERYRLGVAVDDRNPESFEIEGPDDRCTTEIRIEANATVEVGQICA
ncbi:MULTISPECIES: hypothetical protein [Halorussus]|uniref:hypothetical protein n=1 Tax=Halorussus TaxID=1070314 RepID=UPI00209D38EF|nr:hypothetical protein [Halorussus vallis]USZ75207.1 hypothetical protein NGM07_17450 [Halorussus vallis]